jgi:hypothetical protein
MSSADVIDGVRYILLCRHAKHQSHELVPDDTGKFPTELVADRLHEQLLTTVTPGSDLTQIRLGGIRYAPSREALQTVALLGEGLGSMQVRLGHGADDWRDIAVIEKHGQLNGRVKVYGPNGEVLYTVPAEHDHLLEAWHAAGAPELDTTIADGLLDVAATTPSNEGEPVSGTVRPQRDREQNANAVLVVGHMPQLGRLADELSRSKRCPARRRRHLQLPLAQSEVACLIVGRPRFPGLQKDTDWGERRARRLARSALRAAVRLLPARLRWRSPRVLWTIAPQDAEALADVRDKIKSKLNTATVLGGVITVVLSALLAVLFDEKKWGALADSGGLPGQVAAQVAAGLLLAAIALYLASVYAYDRLLMPPRFWGEAGRGRSVRGRALVRRPPSSSVWVLYQNMQRVWWGLFTPATLCVGAALCVLALAFVRATGLALVALCAGALLVALLVWWFRPVLGSED